MLPAFASNWVVWGVLAAATLFIGLFAFVRPHHHDSTPPKRR